MFSRFFIFNTVFIMQEKVCSFISKYKLLDQSGKNVLVGLSGGADSVSLLGILCKLGYSCVALHCNFHLRGDESDRDALFAETFAEKLKVPYYHIDFNTTEYAKDKHLSIEMAARKLRYDWFESMYERMDAQAIAVAHHKDDSIETLIMNMMRGTGLRGLTGIHPKNGHIVRPLLCVSRRDILDWLKENRLSYITDSTNLSDEYTRNFIRLRILPLMEELNPSVRQTLSRTANNLSSAMEIYVSVIEKAKRQLWHDNSIQITDLLAYPSPETILYELLQPYGFSSQVVSSIFNSLGSESGKTFYSSDKKVIKDRGKLILCNHSSNTSDITIAKNNLKNYPNDLPVAFELSEYSADFKIIPDPDVAYLDWDKLSETILLRHWKHGDWFIPFGMKGKKKVSDYFTDHKYSLDKKERQLILCSADDIVWLVGERIDDRYRVTSKTKHVLIAKKSFKENE